MKKLVTLSEFIIDRQADFPFSTGDLTRLLHDISIAAKIVNNKVNKAGLVDIIGEQGQLNVQGEDQQKLDVLADKVFIDALHAGGEVCGIGSEENPEFMPFIDSVSKKGKYVVLFDPLDGSSNIDVNVSIGTIFSIYRRKSKIGEEANLSDFLQAGVEQVAAGYVIYGSSTMLVYTTGRGVNGFTYNPSIGEFCLSHPQMRIPKNGKIYSINEGNYVHFEQGVKKYIKYCQQEDFSEDRPYTSRYIGSLVADVHRNLIKGGIYMYPGTTKNPNGKLRLLYENNPLAFIVEQAGGIATTGVQRILEIEPTSLHQRSPLFIGSPEMVNKALDFLNEYKNVSEKV